MTIHSNEEILDTKNNIQFDDNDEFFTAKKTEVLEGIFQKSKTEKDHIPLNEMDSDEEMFGDAEPYQKTIDMTVDNFNKSKKIREEEATEILLDRLSMNMALKPRFKIIIEKNRGLILLDIDFNKDIISIIDSVFNGNMRYQRTEKVYTCNYDNLQLKRCQEFIDRCEETFGDLESVFSFSFEVFGEDKPKKPKFNIGQALGINLNEVDNIKTEQKEINKAIKVVKKEIEGESTFVDAGGYIKKSIIESEIAKTQTASEFAYNLVKNSIRVDRRNNEMFFYDMMRGCYVEGKPSEFKAFLVRCLNGAGLSSYTEERKLNEIKASLVNYCIADYRVTDFKRKYTAVRIKYNDEVISCVIYTEKAERLTDKKVKVNEYAFRVVAPNADLMTCVEMNIELDGRKITNKKGESWNGIDDLSSDTYFYNINLDRKSDLFTLFIDKLFASKGFEKMAQQIIGNILSGRKIQKCLMLAGEGNDGKSVLLKMLVLVFLRVTCTFKFNKESRFQYARLKSAMLGLVDEIEEFGFDEIFFKQLIGSSELFVDVKNKEEVKLSDIIVIIAFNYDNLVRLKSADPAMKRRMGVCQCVKEENRIAVLDFERCLLEGFYLESEKREVSRQDGVFGEWIMQGAIDGLNENSLTRESVVEFGAEVQAFNDEVFNRMCPSTDFFAEYTFTKLTDGTAVTTTDLYDFYKEWALKNTPTAVMGDTRFKSEFIKYIKKNLGCNLGISEMRVKVGSSRKRAFPIQILGEELNKYDLTSGKTALKNCGII